MLYLNELHRLALGRTPTPTAIVPAGCTRQSTPESGHRAGSDGAKKRKGSKAHRAVDTLAHLLRVVVTPAKEQERAQVGELCRRVQEIYSSRSGMRVEKMKFTGQ